MKKILTVAADKKKKMLPLPDSVEGKKFFYPRSHPNLAKRFNKKFAI